MPKSVKSRPQGLPGGVVLATVELTRLVLRGFGVYKEGAEFNFKPGVNTYLGVNESGKSTFAAGIAAVIFGLVQSTDTDAFSTERYRSWEDPERFEGEVEFNTSGRKWLIKRSFIDNAVSVRWCSEDSPWQELVRGIHNPRANKPNTAYNGFLRDYLSVDNYELFRQTFFVEQPLPAGDRIESKVQELLSGGGANYQKVHKSLVSDLKELTMDWNTYCHSLGSGRAERRLDVIKRQRRELTQQLNSEGREVEELIGVKEQLALLHKQRGNLQGQLRTYQQVRSAFSSWQTSRDRYELERTRASSLQSALKQAEELQAELAQRRALALNNPSITMDRQLQEVELCAQAFAINHSVEPSNLPIETPDIVERRLSLAASEERLNNRLQQAKARPTRNFWPLVVSILLASATLLVPGGAAGRTLALLISAAGLTISLVWRKQHPSVKIYTDELAEVALQADGLEKAAPFLAERDAAALRKLKQDLIHYSKLRAEAELTIQRLKSESHVVMREKEAALRQVLLQSRVETIEQLKSLAEKQADQIYFSLREWHRVISENPGLPSVDEDMVAVAQSKQTIEHKETQCQLELAALEEMLFALRQKQGELEGKTMHSIAQGEELVHELETEELALTIEAKALGLAIEELETAAEDFQVSHRQSLEQIATQHFRRITQTSRQVLVDEEFCLAVRTEEGRTINPGQLSQGTQDQLYLALRLAIADLTAEHAELPLILDDPFLTSDENRLEHLRQALQNTGRQCLLLSHNTHFANWGTPVR